MKILEMTTILRGGAGVFVTRLTESLRRRNHHVHVVSTGEVEQLTDWDELLNCLGQIDTTHHQFNFFKREPDIFWAETERLSELLLKEQFDVIHAHAGVPALGASIARKMAGLNIPIIATFHSWSKDRPNWMNVQDTYAFNQCQHVFFDSQAYMAYGSSFGLTSRHEVIYPGLLIDPTPYLDKRQNCRLALLEQLNLPNNVRLISNLAEITERKGQLDLIKSLPLVLEQEDVYLLFIGECRNEHYRNLINQTIDEHKLSEKVRFMGWVDDPYEIVAGTDLFVFPSYSEGLGMAIAEAISLGVPAVFSSIEGMKDIEDILGEYSMGTFEAGNIPDIAEKILQVLRKDASRKSVMMDKGAELIRTAFAFDTTVTKYEKAMYHLVNR